MKEYLSRMKAEKVDLENRINKNIKLLQNPPYDIYQFHIE